MPRRVISILLIVVASLLAPVAIVALWAERTVTDSETFVETIAPLAQDPIVQQTVAAEVSTALIDGLDVEGRLSAAASDSTGPIAELLGSELISSSIASGINGAIESAVASYTSGDRFGDLWTALAGELQKSFVRLIEPDQEPGAVTLTGGQIVLDTQIAVERIQAALVERGVPFADQLEAVPSRDLVLADTPKLQQAADLLRIFLPVASWLWLGVLLVFALATLLWRPRARGLMWTGFGMATGGLVLFLALNIGQNAIVNGAPTEGMGSLIEALSGDLLRFLISALLVMMLIGVSLVCLGWLGGGTESGRAARLHISARAQSWGAPLAQGKAASVIATRPNLIPALRLAVGGASLLILFGVHRVTPSTVVWVAVGAVAALLLVEALVGAAQLRRTQSDQSDGPDQSNYSAESDAANRASRSL